MKRLRCYKAADCDFNIEGYDINPATGNPYNCGYGICLDGLLDFFDLPIWAREFHVVLTKTRTCDDSYFVELSQHGLRLHTAAGSTVRCIFDSATEALRDFGGSAWVSLEVDDEG